MSVSALKEELRKRGAKLSGPKEQLVKRLVCLLFTNTFIDKSMLIYRVYTYVFSFTDF